MEDIEHYGQAYVEARFWEVIDRTWTNREQALLAYEFASGEASNKLFGKEPQ